MHTHTHTSHRPQWLGVPMGENDLHSFVRGLDANTDGSELELEFGLEFGLELELV